MTKKKCPATVFAIWRPLYCMNRVSSHLIEKQVSHGTRNRIRATYNFAAFLPERRKTMQAWSDYPDQLKA